MFSAVKLVAAGGIVALFSGFLMSGVLTTQEGEPTPATTTDELLAGFVTDEVEPGVTAILNDGYRELHHPQRSFGIDGGIVVAGDGQVWIVDGFGEFFRLGDEATHDLGDQFLMDDDPGADRDNVYPIEPRPGLLHGGPDGRLWLISGNAISFFDASVDAWESWNGDIRAADMAVDGTGTVWAILADELVRFDAERVPTRYPLPEGYREIESLMVSADGVAHVTAGPSAAHDEWSEEADILRLVDGTLVPVASEATPSLWPMAAAPGGKLWTGEGYDWEAGDFPHHGLKRLDEAGWTMFTAEDGVRPWGGKMGFYPLEMIAASPDGSVWVDATTSDGECDGLGRFDGQTWTPHLAGHCISDIDFTSDGDAWVLVSGPYLKSLSSNVQQVGVFLIEQ